MTANLTIPPEFESASRDERIAFVEALWDRIAQEPDNVPISDEHKRILDERLASYRAAPESGRPWSEVRDRLLTRLRRS